MDANPLLLDRLGATHAYYPHIPTCTMMANSEFSDVIITIALKYWEKEANIAESIALGKTAHMHDIPKSTVIHCHKHQQTCEETDIFQQLLSLGAKDALGQFSICMNHLDFPVRIDIH